MGAQCSSLCSSDQKEKVGGEEPDSPSKKRASKPGEDSSKKIAFLKKVPLFRDLDTDMLQGILNVSEEVKFAAGEDIITQGDDGCDFFVVIKGTTKVSKDKKEVAKLTVGDYFGEGALLNNEKRSATIKAVDKVMTIKVAQAEFQELGLQEHLNIVDHATHPESCSPKVSSIHKKGAADGKKSRKSCNDGGDFQKKCKFLSKIPLFSKLDEDMLKLILGIAEEQRHDPGTAIITQGEEGSDLFLIIRGEVAVEVDTKEVAKLSVGDYFGEHGLLSAEKRGATCKARDKVLCMMISKPHFDKLDLREHLHIVEKG